MCGTGDAIVHVKHRGSSERVYAMVDGVGFNVINSITKLAQHVGMDTMHGIQGLLNYLKVVTLLLVKKQAGKITQSSAFGFLPLFKNKHLKVDRYNLPYLQFEVIFLKVN